MVNIIVNVDVKSDRIKDFLEATKNSQNKTLNEDGCNLYKILQDENDPTKIVLIEEYSSKHAFEYHKTTPYFQEWRNDVYEMMNTPRVSSKYIEK